MKNLKYTKELLEPLVKSSKSISEVLRKLGKNFSGGLHCHVKSKIKKFKIDTSHFLGYSVKCGQKSNNNKKHWSKVLVEGIYFQGPRLRTALIESGRAYICQECGQMPMWNGKKLVLQVDHEDGDKLNNCENNLRFLCPNCHTQTENWGSRNRQ